MAAPKEVPLPKPAAAPEPEKHAPAPVVERAVSAAPEKEPVAPAAGVQAPPAAKAEPAPAAPSLAQEPKTEEHVSETPAAEVRAAASVQVPPAAKAEPSPVAPPPAQEPKSDAARPVKAAPVQPVELPESSGELEVASPLEQISSGAESAWSRRAIEVDFSSEASSTESSFPEGELQLASMHEFIPTWDPSAEPAATDSSRPVTESYAGWDSDEPSAPEDAASGNAQIQQMQLEEALEALRQATTRSELGNVLLSYSRGRFQRGFLLGETFGYARVGRGYGPGSDKPEVSALQVDLEAPSLLAMAAAGGRAVVSSVPEHPQDEALFGALAESFSHLVAAPIRLQQRTVGFIVIDGGPSPFGPEELDDLEKLTSAASEAYDRLQAPSM